MEKVIVIGSGFSGLSAAYELAKAGCRPLVLEADDSVGGLAGSFSVNGTALEKFYHHWFNNDRHIMELIEDLGLSDDVLLRSSNTGMYFANKIYRLASPLDLLRFGALGPIDRIRLGLLTLRVRRVDDWKPLEDISAMDWLRRIGGEEVFRVVWEPLLRGKFGPYAEDVSAVWFWNKLKLRGGSRSKGGGEQLAYFKGGFAAVAEQMVARIEQAGGRVETGAAVEAINTEGGRVTGVRCQGGRTIAAERVVATPALPLVADMLQGQAPSEYLTRLRRIKYLANTCLVFQLRQSLSDTYWLNVNDAEFPYVGVIEHTNFEPPATYDGKHIVYLSKYLAESDPQYQMGLEETVEFSIPHLKRMFPDFSRDWIAKSHLWRARFSQPIVERHYSQLIPAEVTPLAGLFLCTMAQVYPEDRGTNYAVREGRRLGRRLAGEIVTQPAAGAVE